MKTVVFIQPKVIALASSYVCVRIEGKQMGGLQKRFGVRGTPSYAVVGADGKALGTFVGATDDAGIFKLLEPPLQKAVEAAEEELAAARKLLEQKEHLRAYLALQRLAGKLSWSEPAKAAAELKKQIEADAAVWPTVEAGLQEEQARELVGRAQRHLVKKEYAEGLALLERAARECPKAPSGQEAGRKAKEMREDPAVLQAMRAAAQEKQARAWWNLASSFLRNKLVEQARGYLKKIVEHCPDTKYAELARQKLAELD